MTQRPGADASISASTHERFALEEGATTCFEMPPQDRSLDDLGGLNAAQLLTWFGADEGSAIPPCYLLEVVAILTFGQPMSTDGLGAKLISEFGSIRGVLAADTERLFRWLEKEGQADWFIKHFVLRIKATFILMKQALSEEIVERPIIDSWQSLLDYLKIAMGSDPIEHFRVIFLNAKNYIIKDEVQQRGTVNHTPLYPREIAKRSLELGASAVIMVHNHPSGDPTPSRADIEMTKQVQAALTPIQISLHDHLIIGSDGHISFASEQII